MALACDLEIDLTIATGHENHKWSWFRRYCHAARVANAIIHRTSLPRTFCLELRKKFSESSLCTADDVMEHENHTLFKKEQDEQLLVWLNR